MGFGLYVCSHYICCIVFISHSLSSAAYASKQTLHISPHKHIFASQATERRDGRREKEQKQRHTNPIHMHHTGYYDWHTKGGKILSAQRIHTPITILRVPLMMFAPMTAAMVRAFQPTTLLAISCPIFTFFARILSNTEI